MKGIAFGNMGAYIFGAQAVELEVDEVTGQVDVLRAWAASDVGQAVNPTNVEGQIQGGFVQGMGLCPLRGDGLGGRPAHQSIDDGLTRFRAPLIRPAKIKAIIVEEPEPSGPFGAKGVGEPAMVGVAPAVGNAIRRCGGRAPAAVADDAGEGPGEIGRRRLSPTAAGRGGAALLTRRRE